METQSFRLLALLHPKIKDEAVAAWVEACQKTPVNVHPMIIETIRSFKESDHDYDLGRLIVNPDGRTKHKPMGNIISYAKAGQSYHNYGLAFDLVMLVDGKEDWAPNMIVVNTFKKHGFTWGGDWPKPKKDTPHFEKKLGFKWSGLLALHNRKEFITGTNYLNI